MLLFNSKALLSQRKPRDAAENFDTCRNLQPHRAVLPAIARHLVLLENSFQFIRVQNFSYTSAWRRNNVRRFRGPRIVVIVVVSKPKK